MIQKIFIYFCIFATLALEAAPSGVFYNLQLEDAENSPRARMLMLINHIRYQCALLLPSSRLKRKSHPVIIHYASGKQKIRFEMNQDPVSGKYRIMVPGNIYELSNYPNALQHLVCWYLLSRAGLDAKYESQISNSWYVTGLTRRIGREFLPGKRIFSSYYPAAYTLAASGKYPTLESLLSVPLSSEDMMSRLVYEEYSELLLYLCIRSGFFKKGLLVALLDDFRYNPRRTDMAVRFKQITQPMATVWKQKQKSGQFDPELWYRKGITSLLNVNFLPVSASYAESHYHQALVFTAKLKRQDEDGKNDQKGGKKDNFLTGNLHDLIAQYDKLENPGKEASKMAVRITTVSLSLSPDLVAASHQVRDALYLFAKKQNTASVNAIQNADAVFHSALERHLLLEKFLQETERNSVSVAARYYLTLSVLNHQNGSDPSYMKQLTHFLDQTTGKKRSL